jgi:hypothetical protein
MLDLILKKFGQNIFLPANKFERYATTNMRIWCILQVEDIAKEFPVVSQRAKMVFGVHMPTIPALRKYVLIHPSLLAFCSDTNY